MNKNIVEKLQSQINYMGALLRLTQKAIEGGDITALEVFKSAYGRVLELSKTTLSVLSIGKDKKA